MEAGCIRQSGAKTARSPLSFVGLFPVGRLCAWLDGCLCGKPGCYRAESEGWDGPLLSGTQKPQHHNVCHRSSQREGGKCQRTGVLTLAELEKECFVVLEKGKAE